MSHKVINATEFWDLYFRNKFLKLERRSDKYIGLIFDKIESAGKGLFNDDRVTVEIYKDNLKSYQYDNDGRFALLSKRPIRAKTAIKEIINQSYPYRDAAPFGKKRMSELFLQMYPSEIEVNSVAMLEQTVLTLVQQYNQDLSQLLAAHAWLLGELRQCSSSKALLNIIHHAPFVLSVSNPLPFTPIDVAFSALWKINDKSSLLTLLKLLYKTTDAGKRKIIPLFERLLSTNKLLSLTECDDYYEVEFWRSILMQRKDFTKYDWASYDTSSLFWEIRYLAAIRLPSKETKMLTILINDEVKIISDIAYKKLNAKN